MENKNEGEEKEVMSSKEYKYYGIIATLPTRKALMSEPLYKYGNFWYSPSVLAAAMAFQEEFKPLSTDIFLATYPKSGTTWIKALAFAAANRARFAFDQNHPLLTSSPHVCVPFVGLDCNQAINSADSYAYSPRLLAVHIPYSALPASVTDSGCRIVYMCRDPKDAFISVWNFLRKYVIVSFDKAFELFCEGVSSHGPVWEHILEYWTASLKHPEKILFFKYEELQAEPAKSVVRLAEFVGHPFSEEEMKEGVVEEIVKLCNFETLSKTQGNNKGQFTTAGFLTVENSAYFRKGKVGDWKEHLTAEMAKKLDDITEEKLKGSGLAFGR